MLPRVGGKDRVSEVRFSSSTASLIPDVKHPASALPNGRKMVLNPRPIQLPVNAASGPRVAGVALTGHAVRSCLTSLIEKLTGEASAVTSPLVSTIRHLQASPQSDGDM